MHKPRFYNYDAYRAVMDSVHTVKGVDKFVLATIATYVNTTIRAAWMSAATLSADTGLCDKSIRNAINALLAAGELIESPVAEVSMRALGKDYTVKTRVFTLPVLEQIGKPYRSTPVNRTDLTPVNRTDNKKTFGKKKEDIAGKPAVRPRNAIWDAVVLAQYGLPTDQLQLTTSQQTDIGKTVRELTALAATPENIACARRQWDIEFPNATFTHRCLRMHWATLVNAAQPQAPQRATRFREDE